MCFKRTDGCSCVRNEGRIPGPAFAPPHTWPAAARSGRAAFRVLQTCSTQPPEMQRKWILDAVSLYP